MEPAQIIQQIVLGPAVKAERRINRTRSILKYWSLKDERKKVSQFYEWFGCSPIFFQEILLLLALETDDSAIEVQTLLSKIEKQCPEIIDDEYKRLRRPITLQHAKWLYQHFVARKREMDQVAVWYQDILESEIAHKKLTELRQQ